MFVIKLDSDVKNIVTDKLYNDIVKYNIMSNIILIYDVDSNFDKNINASCYYVHADKLIDVDEDDLEEIILDLADKKSIIIIDKLEQNTQLLEIINFYGIEYFEKKDIEFKKDITIENLNKVDLLNCKDILENNYCSYDFNSIILRFNLDKDGNMICKETGEIFNIHEKDLIHIFDYSNKMEQIINETADLEVDINTTTNNLIGLIFNSYKKSDLFEYRINLYNIVRHLKPEYYTSLYSNFSYILNNFINIDDIEKILEENYVI